VFIVLESTKNALKFMWKDIFADGAVFIANLI
jgi:hypothetical protein